MRSIRFRRRAAFRRRPERPRATRSRVVRQRREARARKALLAMPFAAHRRPARAPHRPRRRTIASGLAVPARRQRRLQSRRPRALRRPLAIARPVPRGERTARARVHHGGDRSGSPPRRRLRRLPFRHSQSIRPSSSRRSQGAIAPSGTARGAPVARGTFDGASAQRFVAENRQRRSLPLRRPELPRRRVVSTRALGSRAAIRRISAPFRAPPPLDEARAAGESGRRNRRSDGSGRQFGERRRTVFDASNALSRLEVARKTCAPKRSRPVVLGGACDEVLVGEHGSEQSFGVDAARERPARRRHRTPRGPCVRPARTRRHHVRRVRYRTRQFRRASPACKQRHVGDPSEIERDAILALVARSSNASTYGTSGAPCPPAAQSALRKS